MCNYRAKQEMAITAVKTNRVAQRRSKQQHLFGMWFYGRKIISYFPGEYIKFVAKVKLNSLWFKVHHGHASVLAI